jgi:type II secretory pathway pseudopilin PulG
MQPKQRRKNSGHTLAEVMMAVMMLAACALIFAATLPAAHKSRAKADNFNVATSLAQKTLEEIRTVGFVNTTPAQLATLGIIDSATPVTTNTFSFTNVDNGIVDSPGSTLPNGVGRLTIEDVDIELRRVTAVITWLEAGQTKTVSMAALVANV